MLAPLALRPYTHPLVRALAIDPTSPNVVVDQLPQPPFNVVTAPLCPAYRCAHTRPVAQPRPDLEAECVYDDGGKRHEACVPASVFRVLR